MVFNRPREPLITHLRRILWVYEWLASRTISAAATLKGVIHLVKKGRIASKAYSSTTITIVSVIIFSAQQELAMSMEYDTTKYLE